MHKMVVPCLQHKPGLIYQAERTGFTQTKK